MAALNDNKLYMEIQLYCNNKPVTYNIFVKINK